MNLHFKPLSYLNSFKKKKSWTNTENFKLFTVTKVGGLIAGSPGLQAEVSLDKILNPKFECVCVCVRILDEVLSTYMNVCDWVKEGCS